MIGTILAAARSRRIRRLMVPTALLVASDGIAQEYRPTDRQAVIHAPELIAQCLCGEQRVQSLHRIMERAHQAFQEAEARVTALGNQLDEARGRVDVDSEEQVDAFRRLLEAKQLAEQAMFDTVLPADQAAIARYDEAAKDYDRRCAGRPLDAEVKAEVEASLSCAASP